jgi:hypothetical protein
MVVIHLYIRFSIKVSGARGKRELTISHVTQSLDSNSNALFLVIETNVHRYEIPDLDGCGGVEKGNKKRTFIIKTCIFEQSNM